MQKHFKELQQMFKADKPKETHVYLRNVEKVLDKAKARIKAHEVEALTNENHNRAHAYEMALTELAFIYSEILLEQLKENE